MLVEVCVVVCGCGSVMQVRNAAVWICDLPSRRARSARHECRMETPREPATTAISKRLSKDSLPEYEQETRSFTSTKCQALISRPKYFCQTKM